MYEMSLHRRCEFGEFDIFKSCFLEEIDALVSEIK
jgi:hypothetical protein